MIAANTYYRNGKAAPAVRTLAQQNTSQAPSYGAQTAEQVDQVLLELVQGQSRAITSLTAALSTFADDRARILAKLERRDRAARRIITWSKDANKRAGLVITRQEIRIRSMIGNISRQANTIDLLQGKATPDGDKIDQLQDIRDIVDAAGLVGRNLVDAVRELAKRADQVPSSSQDDHAGQDDRQAAPIDQVPNDGNDAQTDHQVDQLQIASQAPSAGQSNAISTDQV